MPDEGESEVMKRYLCPPVAPRLAGDMELL